RHAATSPSIAQPLATTHSSRDERAPDRLPSTTVGTSYSNGRPRGLQPRAPTHAVRRGGPATFTTNRAPRQPGHVIFRRLGGVGAHERNVAIGVSGASCAQ